MKKLYLIILSTIFLLACSEKDVIITIENPTDFDRMTELVEIPIDSIKNRIVVSDSLVYILKRPKVKLYLRK
jgi:hypothetical protein